MFHLETVSHPTPSRFGASSERQPARGGKCESRCDVFVGEGGCAALLEVIGLFLTLE